MSWWFNVAGDRTPVIIKSEHFFASIEEVLMIRDRPWFFTCKKSELGGFTNQYSKNLRSYLAFGVISRKKMHLTSYLPTLPNKPWASRWLMIRMSWWSERQNPGGLTCSSPCFEYGQTNLDPAYDSTFWRGISGRSPCLLESITVVCIITPLYWITG